MEHLAKRDKLTKSVIAYINVRKWMPTQQLSQMEKMQRLAQGKHSYYGTRERAETDSIYRRRTAYDTVVLWKHWKLHNHSYNE